MWGCLADSSTAVRFHLKTRSGLWNLSTVVAEEGNVVVFFHWSTFMACYLCPATVTHFPVTLVTCVDDVWMHVDFICWMTMGTDVARSCFDLVTQCSVLPSHLPSQVTRYNARDGASHFLCCCYERQVFVTSLQDMSHVCFLCLPICWVVTFPRKRQLMHCVEQRASSFFVHATPKWTTAAAPDGHNLNGKNCTHHAFVTLAIIQSSAERMWRSLIFLCCCYKILWKLSRPLCKTCHMCASDVYLSAGSSRHVTLRHILAQQAAEALCRPACIFFFLCVSLQSEQQHLKVTTCAAKPVHTSSKVVTYASVTPCIMHWVCSATGQ